MILRIAISCIVLFVFGCRKDGKKEETYLPPAVKPLQNLTVYAADAAAPDTVELRKETVFKSNKEIFIKGYIDETAIDSQNRVYISAGRVKTAMAIYVFGPDGRYITTMGRIGKGPGEFLSTGAMHSRNGKLYVFDARLQRISIFSTQDFSFLKNIVIKKDSLGEADSLAKRLRVFDFYINQNRSFLVKMSMIGTKRAGDVPFIVYYRLSSKGMMTPGALLKLPRFKFYFPKQGGRFLMPFPMPFTRSSLTSITKKGDFYVAWTENFLIKHYNQYGEYSNAFYYPIPKSTLSINDFDLPKGRRKVLANYEIPETWPALHTMLLDDKNRLWVATITDGNKTYRWWVLDLKGRLLARFEFKGQRLARTVMAKPNIQIKNGYFYILERDLNKGIDQIVKYKIHFKKN